MERQGTTDDLLYRDTVRQKQRSDTSVSCEFLE